MESFNAQELTRIKTMNLHARPAAKLPGAVARSTRCGRGPAALRQRSHSRFAGSWEATPSKNGTRIGTMKPCEGGDRDSR
jgi:hypothetical protein